MGFLFAVFGLACGYEAARSWPEPSAKQRFAHSAIKALTLAFVGICLWAALANLASPGRVPAEILDGIGLFIGGASAGFPLGKLAKRFEKKERSLRNELGLR